MWSAIAHPATRREQQSITVAKYRFPPVANGKYVMSPTYFVFAVAAVKSRPYH